MLETLFSQFDNLLVLDTETTGINCRTDEIIELAVLRLTQEGGTLHREEMDEFIRLLAGQKAARDDHESDRHHGADAGG